MIWCQIFSLYEFCSLAVSVCQYLFAAARAADIAHSRQGFSIALCRVIATIAFKSLHLHRGGLSLL